MEKQDPEPGPAGANQQNAPQPGGEGGAKGEPDLKAQNARLTQERDDWKKRAEEAEGQLKDLNDSLAKALTEDDVKAAGLAAVEAALAGKDVKKVVLVPGRLVNIVAK